MADPYEVLGVSRDATDDEIKRAYRRLAKQYHPDAHPDDPHAAEKMQEINAAYDQIKNPEKYRSTGPTQSSYDPFSGFGGQGGYYDPFGGYRQQANSTYEDTYLQAARNYIRYGRYQEAWNVLSGMEESRHNAQWYHLSALANEGLGNQVTALEHMKKAVSMDPENPEYLNELNRMEHFGGSYRQQAGNYQGFGLNLNPCSTLCTCMLCNSFCPGWFCCC